MCRVRGGECGWGSEGAGTVEGGGGVLGHGGGHTCLNCSPCISRINNIDNLSLHILISPPTGISQAEHWTKKMKLRQ